MPECFFKSALEFRVFRSLIRNWARLVEKLAPGFQEQLVVTG